MVRYQYDFSPEEVADLIMGMDAYSISLRQRKAEQSATCTAYATCNLLL